MKIRIKIVNSFNPRLYISGIEILLYKPRNYKKLRERNKLILMVDKLQYKIFKIDAHEI
jgi:hypothetical protein